MGPFHPFFIAERKLPSLSLLGCSTGLKASSPARLLVLQLTRPFPPDERVRSHGRCDCRAYLGGYTYEVIRQVRTPLQRVGVIAFT